jgi:dUTP pyrophosphatase
MFKVIRIFSESKLPVKSHDTDIGYDICAIDDGVYDSATQTMVYNTGLIIEPQDGYYLEIYPRSSIYKKSLQLCNSVGIVDPEYRGEIIVKFRLTENLEHANLYKLGDKIAQLIPRKIPNQISFIEVENVSETPRGSGGFGSTDLWRIWKHVSKVALSESRGEKILFST